MLKKKKKSRLAKQLIDVFRLWYEEGIKHCVKQNFSQEKLLAFREYCFGI